MSDNSEKLFKNQLLTAIYSSPLVYIPFFDYGYIDRILADIFPDKNVEVSDGQLPITGLYSDTIYQFDIGRGRVDFHSKSALTSSFLNIQNVLTYLLSRDESIDEELYSLKEEQGLKNCKIILLKNVLQIKSENYSPSAIEDSTVQLLFQSYVQRYWQGAYDPRTTVIMVSPAPVSALPFELKDITTVIDVASPTLAEIRDKVEALPMSQYQETSRHEAIKADLCRTLQGLSMYEIEQILRSMTIRTGGFITSMSNAYALEEKQRIVRKSGIIEVVIPGVTFADVGGLQVLRDDMKKKAQVFKNLSLAVSDRVKLPLPKGILIIGMPGCGKSMIAKSIASEFGVSLLRLDISSLMGQYVGQSEENLRRALRTAEAAHPCVLWIDEIEKAFHGANSSNANENDSLVMRMMGYFLTWMQERKTAVYIVATANDTMRPEFMRKGRFDEVYFVNFPTKEERKAIFESKIRPFQSTSQCDSIFDFSSVSTNELAELTKVNKNDEGFTGAEIECVVNLVVENKFVQYASIKEEDRPKKVNVSMEDMKAIIMEMKKSVLCSQNATDSPVKNIREMKDNYNFKDASTPSSKK